MPFVRQEAVLWHPLLASREGLMGFSVRLIFDFVEFFRGNDSAS